MSRYSLCTLFAGLLLTAMFAGPVSADVSVGVTADRDGIRSFHLAIGEHYGVPEKEVVVVRERHIPENELPVLFYISKRAGAPYSKVVEFRLAGMTWMEITRHFGLTAEIFYLSVERDPGPPYGKAWGHMKNGKKDGWKKVSLTDVEIADWVNLRFMTEQYGLSPEEVIKMRANGDDFVNINLKIKNNKASEHSKQMAEHEPGSNDHPGKGHGSKKK